MLKCAHENSTHRLDPRDSGRDRPICATFKRLWPQAQVTNLLENSLAPDLAAAGRIDQARPQRVHEPLFGGRAPPATAACIDNFSSLIK